MEKVILTGMSLHDVEFNLNIVKSRPYQCSLTVGVHPYHANEPETEGPQYLENLAFVIKDLMIQNPCPITAFGEIGLDYDRLNHASKDAQIRTFRLQLELFTSNNFDLPLFLHCRAAFDDFVDIITPYLSQLPRRGLVHSFVGTTKQMQTLVDMGLDVGVNGFSFKDNDSLEMVRSIPLENLQIETDAPWGEISAKSEVAVRYLTNARPLPASKKKDKFEIGRMVKERNESCSLERIAFVVAGLKGISVEEVAGHAWRNSVSMFRLQVS